MVLCDAVQCKGTISDDDGNGISKTHNARNAHQNAQSPYTCIMLRGGTVLAKASICR